jgi:hypothetical protein
VSLKYFVDRKNVLAARYRAWYLLHHPGVIVICRAHALIKEQRMTSIFARTAILSLSMAVASASGQDYSFELIEFQEPFVSPVSYRCVLSSDGTTLAINLADSNTGLEAPFSWTKNFGFQPLAEVIPPFGTTELRRVEAVNFDGTIFAGFAVYQQQVGPNTVGEYAAVRWNADGSTTIFPGLSTNPTGERSANCLSDTGEIVAGYAYNASEQYRGAIFTGTTTNGIGVPLGYSNSSILDCTPDGLTRAGWVFSDDLNNSALFTKVGSQAFNLITMPSGYVPSAGFSLAASGKRFVAGTLLWDQMLGKVGLPVGPDTAVDNSQISNDGTRIAIAAYDSSSGTGIAKSFIYDFPTLTRVNFFELLQSKGVVIPEGWEFLAQGLSTDGTVIAGIALETLTGKPALWRATLPPAGQTGCVADCDGTGTLSIDDFICFQTDFALGDLAADCDGTVTLSIDDFICFQTSFALGC